MDEWTEKLHIHRPYQNTNGKWAKFGCETLSKGYTMEMISAREA